MVTLRDMQETDILNYVRWFTEEKNGCFGIHLAKNMKQLKKLS